jgi:hypothetical protein
MFVNYGCEKVYNIGPWAGSTGQYVWLKSYLHWRSLARYNTCDIVPSWLALATLDGTTQIGSFLLAKASKEGDVWSQYCGRSAMFTLAMFSVISRAIMQALSHLIYLPWPIEMPKVAKASTIVAAENTKGKVSLYC